MKNPYILELKIKDLEKENQELKEAFVEFLQQADFDENRRIYFIPALHVERIEQLLNKQ